MTADPRVEPRTAPAPSPNCHHFEAVHHVGSLDPRDRRTRPESLEGRHLSVSRYPDAWTMIARLGGRPTWRLCKPGARFAEASRGRRARKAVAAWAVSEGLLLPVPRWEISIDDDDAGSTGYTERSSLEDALDEACGDRSRIHRVAGFAETPALLALVGRHGCRPLDATEIAIDYSFMAWAERSGYDGCWWSERLDPYNYSAPRGCIFESMLSSWTRERA